MNRPESSHEVQPPFFSIIIPVYNRTDSLVSSLKSVLSQTFSDFECLVVDDGSRNSNEIEEIVNNLDDVRFKYFYQHNSGASKARNLGIIRSTGKYIALLDSDDKFVPSKLNTHFKRIQEFTGKYYFAFSRLTADRGVGNFWVKPQFGPKDIRLFDQYLLCTHGWAQTSTQVLNSELAKLVLFDEGLPSSQDTDFALRCWSFGADVIFIPEALTIMDDVFNPQRLSKQSKHIPLLNWIERMKHVHISDKAYWGYRGWQVARVASYQNRTMALTLFFPSLIRGTYSLRMAMNIFAQIVIPLVFYQRIATLVVKLFGFSTKKRKQL
jgi:glycosyltransferase involved in cell wall biosynthesis